MNNESICNINHLLDDDPKFLTMTTQIASILLGDIYIDSSDIPGK